MIEQHDVSVHLGDARTVLASLPSGSVQCIVTSPPYYGLRDYGTGTWEGGTEDCDHQREARHQTQGATSARAGRSNTDAQRNETHRSVCGKCGARRVDHQLGLEPSPGEYVAAMVAVFAEARRVLAADGVLWLNLGDSYSGSWGNQGRKDERGTQRPISAPMNQPVHDGRYPSIGSNTGAIKPGAPPAKNLLGIPWRVAFALQDDGWTLRNAVIWAKPNAMPESVTDRLSTRYEHVFLFSKSRSSGPEVAEMSDVDAAWLAALIDGEGTVTIARNRRSLVDPSHVDVFSTILCVANTSMPLLEKASRLMGDSKPKLNNVGVNRPVYAVQISGEKAARVIRRIRPFLIDKAEQARVALALQVTQRKAGTPTGSYRGADARAYKERLWLAALALNRREAVDLGWVVDEKPTRRRPEPYWFDLDPIRDGYAPAGLARRAYNFRASDNYGANPVNTGGAIPANEQGKNPGDVWTIPTSPFPGAHFACMPPELARRCTLAGCPEGGTVLDPFTGSGTTAMVARQLGRRFVGAELNPAYIPLIEKRIGQEPFDFGEVSA